MKGKLSQAFRQGFYKIAGKTMRDDNMPEPTQEMVDWFEKRTARHRRLVRKYALLIHKHMDMPNLSPRASKHDKSKLHPPERYPYIFITWDHKVDDYEIPDKINKLEATRHHILNNSHHPEYHDPELTAEEAEDRLNPEDRDWGPDGEAVDATQMPKLDIAEMIADCSAMSEELGNNTVREWFDEKIGERWNFTDEQEDFIYKVISALESDPKAKGATGD